jgi:Glu-tRNA(Gln) amidotransferase subunit E-like FAD-binding protein
MDRLKKLIRESLVAHLNEADSKKKDDIIVPQGCFGGPKHHIGALVNIVELLKDERDENGTRAVDDLKQFLKGSTKADPKVVVQILRKHHKPQFIPFTGCL